MAVARSRVAVAWGAANSIYFSESTDGGQTFREPLRVVEAGMLSLGNHRGPRVAITPTAIVISAIYGANGKGADGDLVVFRSTDDGRTWSPTIRVNDKPSSAREGLHSVAADGDFLYAVWLDDRNGGKELYGAGSTDGGATWAPNQRIYSSPDGHICECCHPSVAVRAKGEEIYAMFRNWLGGSRDFYLAESRDGGASFATRKVGQGTWQLNACPMDGGGLVVDSAGPLTVWRRGATVFLDRPGKKETEIGAGKNPAIAGNAVVWSAADGLRMKDPSADSILLDPDGAYPAAASDGAIATFTWESKGRIVARTTRLTGR